LKSTFDELPQVKLQKLPEALNSAENELRVLGQLQGNDHGAAARLTCAVVLIHLHIGDQVSVLFIVALLNAAVSVH